MKEEKILQSQLKQHRKGSQYGGYLFEWGESFPILATKAESKKVTNMVGTFLNESGDGFRY